MKYKTIEVNGFTVPASKRDAIKKMIDGIEKGVITPEASCKNMNDAGEKCPIGYMLTDLQMECAKQDAELGSSVIALSWKYGEQNITTMMGMSLNDANKIQCHFDLLSEEFMIAVHAGGEPSIDEFNKNFIKFLKKQAKQ